MSMYAHEQCFFIASFVQPYSPHIQTHIPDHVPFLLVFPTCWPLKDRFLFMTLEDNIFADTATISCPGVSYACN